MMQNEKKKKKKKKKDKKKSLVKYRLVCLTPSIHCCLEFHKRVGQFYPDGNFHRFRPLLYLP